MEMFSCDEFQLSNPEKFRGVPGAQGVPTLYVLAPPPKRILERSEPLAGREHLHYDRGWRPRIVSGNEAERLDERPQHHAGYFGQGIESDYPRSSQFDRCPNRQWIEQASVSMPAALDLH